ncbi:MAG: hypothetical protein CMP23_01105 [Rickettsiales bacterium]|nr:hypothetical protein [Rickettsiales bacterium]
MRAVARVAALALLGLLLLTSCEATECETSANCENGTVCTESGRCVEVSCHSSVECPIETWCNSDSGACEPGCLSSRDCLPTNICDEETRQCVLPGCRNTDLDCDLGQFCNALSGQCYDAGRPATQDTYYCKSCESRADCNGGVDGPNWCLRMGGSSQTYCGVDCSAGQQCPRGYSCGRVRTVGDVTVAYQCVAPCWEY